MSLPHVLMLLIFLISVTSPFTRLMDPCELASFWVSATKKALRKVWIRTPCTLILFPPPPSPSPASPVPFLNVERIICTVEMVLHESSAASLVFTSRGCQGLLSYMYSYFKEGVTSS